MQGRRRVLSPAKEHLATCAEASSFLGMRVRQVGAVYAVCEKGVVGRIATGETRAARLRSVRKLIAWGNAPLLSQSAFPL